MLKQVSISPPSKMDLTPDNPVLISSDKRDGYHLWNMLSLVNNFSFLLLYKNHECQWKIVRRIANEHRHPNMGKGWRYHPVCLLVLNNYSSWSGKISSRKIYPQRSIICYALIFKRFYFLGLLALEMHLYLAQGIENFPFQERARRWLERRFYDEKIYYFCGCRLLPFQHGKLSFRRWFRQES